MKQTFYNFYPGQIKLFARATFFWRGFRAKVYVAKRDSLAFGLSTLAFGQRYSCLTGIGTLAKALDLWGQSPEGIRSMGQGQRPENYQEENIVIGS
jgi:hypothetical protein